MFKVFKNMVINTDQICSIEGPDTDRDGRFTLIMSNGDRYKFYSKLNYHNFVFNLDNFLNSSEFETVLVKESL